MRFWSRGAIVLSVLASALLVGEGVFRAILPMDQAPLLQWDSATNLLRHLPHQTGFRYPSGNPDLPVRYDINAQGWNAPVDYFPPGLETSDHLLVIGDSFVEALQVEHRESLMGQLDFGLNTRWQIVHDGSGEPHLAGTRLIRVYGFGMSGAPLSEYLHIARHVVHVYDPVQIIIVLVHNDFTESFDPPAIPIYQAFARVQPVHGADGQVIRVDDLPGVPYVSGMGSRVIAGEWATGRAAVRSARNAALAWRQLRFDRGHLPPEMGVDMIEVVTHAVETLAVTDYLFGQFAKFQEETGIPLLFVMDAPRDTIEINEDPTTASVYALNVVAAAAAKKHGLAFLDLTPAFTADWKAHHQRFSFPADYHWNAYAHHLVAETILQQLRP